MERNVLSGKILIVGLGIMIPDHVTPQAQRALSTCSKVFSIVQEPPILWFPAAALLNISVVNLLSSYREDVPRTQNYEAAARTILDECLGGKTVGYVTYGNPMCYDSVAPDLVRTAPDRNAKVEVIPGISSLDTILCDLRMDMAPAFQIYEASGLLVCEIKPVLTVPVLLLQMGTFGSFRMHYSERRDGRSLTALVQYLTRYYPGTHEVILVRSTGDARQPTRATKLAIQDLGMSTAEDLSGSSLIIPALFNPLLRKDLAAKMLEL